MKWEYKTYFVKGTSISGDLSKPFNQYGAEGWELVSSNVTYIHGNTPPEVQMLFVFKRQV